VALNIRGMDPRFPFHHRNVVRGWMVATIEVLQLSSVTPQTAFTKWDPLNPNYAEQGTPTSRSLQTPIYRGQGRIEPNKDWRARKVEHDAAIETWHAVRVQVDLNGNLMPEAVDGEFLETPNAGALVIVLDCIDQEMVGLRYAVRNWLGTSNTWQRTMLCDVLL